MTDPPEQLLSGRVVSHVQNVQSAESEWDDIRAILWLPDPESRRGWREFYVRSPQQTKPGGRVGFSTHS